MSEIEKAKEEVWGADMTVALEGGRCFPLLIHLADGRRVVFPEVAPCDLPKLRELSSVSLGLFMEALAVALTSDSDGEVIQHFVETVDLALKMPQFVEALKQRGAVVLGPGETMEGEHSAG